ncbi:MAG: hypothetical protein ACLFP8_08005 [Alphaproteobacteria bacterium]
MKLYIPVFSLTLLLSAALLFTIQPMFSKMVLPLLGGSPQTWNTSMLFFQVSLLAGYAYAHATSHFLNIRVQAVLHIVLLVTFFFVLPPIIPKGLEPPAGTDPTLWQIAMMAAIVGGPFFVISCSAPMLQRWFSATPHKDANDPYFLYGASNLGSVAGLLLYPVLIEPFMRLNTQGLAWMYGYAALIVLTSFCAVQVWKYGQSSKAKNNKFEISDKDHNITWALRRKWLILAFIPSALMLALTTHITTDVASVPLLWVLPLALYIGTFVLVFARKPLFSSQRIMTFSGMAVIILCLQMIAFKEINTLPVLAIFLHLTVFFLLALACHTSLAQSRPAANRLTEFYFFMSLGGALGGFFNAIIVPNFFIIPIEYPLMLIAAVGARYINVPQYAFSALIQDIKKAPAHYFNFNNIALLAVPMVLGGIGICIYDSIIVQTFTALVFLSIGTFFIDRRWFLTMIVIPPLLVPQLRSQQDVILRDRSFFGVIKVLERDNQRMFKSGSTLHGSQPLSKEHALKKISYYGSTSPIADLFSIIDSRPGEQRVAILGLGIGVTACYTKEGRHFDYYEIDQKVVKIAEDPKYFTYLSDCGSPYDIIMGDARLSVEKQPDSLYDLILVDTFSSDSIPVHLMTTEAIKIYIKKLKSDGFVMVQVSNRYLDLEPVLSKIGEKIGLPAYAKLGKGEVVEDTGIKTNQAHIVVFAKDQSYIGRLEEMGWDPARERTGVTAWTDQFSNILSSFNNVTGLKRRQELREKALKSSKKEE